MTSPKDYYIGRLMRPVGGTEPIYVVTDVGYDISAGKDSLHLRRIRPLPPIESEPRLSTELEECTLDEISSSRDGLAQVVARVSPRTLGVWTALNSRTEFKEYQFRPLLKYLRSPLRRILIADEVGLGKTIEAAYIIVEELASGLTKRVLVLCPAGLRLKWQDELWHRFGLYFQITNGKGLKNLLSAKGGFMTIVSYDSRWEDETPRGASSNNPIDLLVVDEVHNLIGRGGETQRRTMASSLSRISGAVVSLSATPIQLEMDDLRRVLEVTLGRRLDNASFDRDARTARLVNKLIVDLQSKGRLSNEAIAGAESMLEGMADDATKTTLGRLREGGVDDRTKAELVLSLAALNPFDNLMTRTRKKDVGALIPRNVHNYGIPLDEVAHTRAGLEGEGSSERNLYAEVDGLLKDSFSHVHRLQLSSCLPAMIELLRDGMKGFDVWKRDEQVLSELSVADQGDPEDFRRVQGTLPAGARVRCADLVDRFGLVRVDNKLRVLRSMLESLRDSRPDGLPHKAIVFTQWRHTWAYLVRRLGTLDGIRPFALSGDDNPRKVVPTLKEFDAHDGPALLISTDFLSEGLDLQAADTLVNYDFPYNPQRVEQRIGRIDRIGQRASDISIHNLVVSGSLDEEILGVLRGRLDIFQEGMGDSPALFQSRQGGMTETESRVAERRQSSSERELVETLPFKGVEDLLDEQTRRLRSTKTGDLARMNWAMVVRMLSLFSGGRAKIVDETSDFVKVGPLDEQDIEAVCAAVGMVWGERVRWELLSERDEHSILKIAKTPSDDGLFLSPLHPLVRRALRVTLNSFGGQDKKDSPLCLLLSSIPAEYVAIFKYVQERAGRTQSVLAYWSESEGRIEKLEGEKLLRILEIVEYSEMRPVHREIPLSRLRNRVELDFKDWSRSESVGWIVASERTDVSPAGSLVEHIATIYQG